MDRRRFLTLFSFAGAALSCRLRQRDMSWLNRIMDGSKIKVDFMDVLFEMPDVQIRGLVVPGSQAIDGWKELRKRVTTSGYWPILVGDLDAKDDLARRTEIWDDETTNSILDKAAALDVDAWLTSRQTEILDGEPLPRGPWPRLKPRDDGFIVHLDLDSGRPLKEVYLALIPTENGWQAPAFLRFGGWNDCPPPEVHAALWAKWEKEYGAEIVAITADTIECAVSNPPQSREAALRLAEQQFVYAPDSTYQGVESVEWLGAFVLKNQHWYFWWD